jgi:mevalonate kinase
MEVVVDSGGEGDWKMEEAAELVVEARAPGKVILSGEHAVVHGTAAVAAALGLYSTARIRHRPLSPGEALCL